MTFQAAQHLPQVARRRAESLGEPGLAWIAGLDDLVGALADEWGFSVMRYLAGGTAALVAEVAGPGGAPMVLKLSVPGLDPNDSQARVLALGQGRGYAALYQRDAERGALLMEKLGPSLQDLGWDEARRQEAICATLLRAWRTLPDADGYQTGAEKAEGLAGFALDLWTRQHGPCGDATMHRLYAFAEQRRRAFEADRSVLAHGDAHQWNTLLVPGSDPPAFKFVDPEGIFVEREYDLAIPMREDAASLLAGDPVELGLARCRRLAALTGTDPGPIWQWGFIERVSTGLLCLSLDMEGAQDFLTVADAWADVDPPA